MAKPAPKHTNTICTACGLSWEKHKQGRPSKDSRAAVTLEDCVRVLKAELAARPRMPAWQASANTISQSAAVPLAGNYFGVIASL